MVRATHHGPLVNEALRADPDEPLALSWTALEAPCVTEASLAVLPVRSGPELVASLAPHNAPVSNLVWADRQGSIGYKMIGLVPLRARRLPGPAEAGLDRRARVAGPGPLRRAPRAGRSRAGLRPHRQQPDHPRGLPAPHHQRLARRLPGAPDRGPARRRGRARPRRLRADPDRHALDPRARDRPPARPPARPGPARDGGDRAPAELGRGDGAGLGRGDDLPGVHAAASRAR